MSTCTGHAGLPADVRAAVLGALDRIGPILDRMHAQQAGDAEPAPAPDGRPCAVCPVCAVIAAWRGERSELAARTVEHAAGMVAVLRAALDEGAGAAAAAHTTTGEGAARHEAAPARAVQRISVHR
ncbi:MAG: hypothetical protein ACT4RN_10660 [Pseudonocardia sp.]